MVISDFCLGLERFWHILLFFPSNLCIPLCPLWLGTGFQRIPLCIVLFPVCLLYFTFCDCVVFYTAVSFGSLSCFLDHVGLILAILVFPLSIFFISVFFSITFVNCFWLSIYFIFAFLQMFHFCRIVGIFFLQISFFLFWLASSLCWLWYSFYLFLFSLFIRCFLGSSCFFRPFHNCLLGCFHYTQFFFISLLYSFHPSVLSSFHVSLWVALHMSFILSDIKIVM